DLNRLLHLLEEALEKGIIADAAPAQSGAETERFWKIREEVHIMEAYCKNTQYFDISLPVPLIGEVVEKMVKELYTLPEVERVFYFGHVADGNIHLVVGKKVQNEALISQINDIVDRPLQAIGGSVSAEHGIGLHKKAYLPISRNAEEITLMRQLKQMMDPKGILNRGKVVDSFIPDKPS
ncbi:MAG: FAD-binding oxidoreductase, partial [Bacteroidetes bacterium]|nr:FAD-binding oxidoreductase [Bacteroidota bacterium]